MKFRRLNDNTINCIISREDLQKNGLMVNDLFERKDKAIRFIRNVLLEAAREQNFSLSDDYTAMRITILPDQSVSLTLSVGRQETQEDTEAAAQEPQQGIYLFSFSSMREVIRCVKSIPLAEGIGSSLYVSRDGEEYYLILQRDTMQGADFERIVLSMNEFGTLVSGTASRISFLKEHSEPLIAQEAIRTIWEM